MATAKVADTPKQKAKADKAPTMVADKKTEKKKPSAPSKRSDSNSGGAKAISLDKKKKIIIASVAVLVILLTVLILVLSLKACVNNANNVTFVNTYKNVTQVGVASETIGTVDRYKPVEGVHDGGLVERGVIPKYPKYGSTVTLNDAQKAAILAENRSLCAKPTSNTGGVYDWMDKDGYLYEGTRENPLPLMESADKQRQLYKHTGSVGLYLGDVSDDEQAVVKSFTFRPRSYGSYYEITGLYAPAGEVIKIQLSNEDMLATGGIVIHIGQALYNGQCNNIWAARNFNRMPIILNTMYVTTNTAEYDETTDTWTAYVGSYVGGPIYVRNETPTYNVTISGGVTYAHFILGVTSEEEYNQSAKSSVPFFDLEVWDSGVLHSGPMIYAKRFSYEDLYKAAILWEKVSLVSSRVVNQGIVFIYDCFVAAGAAVAFPGRRSVNCPGGWMTNSLNYNSIVTSGAWGNLHEYHHNFQNYGVGDRGEVTNNGLNLVSYSLFTKISSSRSISNFGAAGLSGWNTYTSATWALNRVNTGQIRSTNGLAMYSTLLHNLGQDAYVKSTGASGAAYYNKWAANTHQDMTYYMGLVSAFGGSYSLAENTYPMFVPVSSVYQTGRSYMYDNEKRYIETMQPYVITYGKQFEVDLRPYTNNAAGQYESGSIVIGNGFKYSIKNVDASNVNGTFVESDVKGVYTFTPNAEMLSGKIYVTLEITTTSGEHTYLGKKLDDVDLVLEFQQSHEGNKAILERTTYSYDANNMYTDAEEAFNNGFKNYAEVVQRDHANPTQNANTDIWLIPPQNLNRFPNATEWQLIDANTKNVEVIDGKLYFSGDGKYRIYLRGRKNCALYYSLDGKSYSVGATVKNGSGSAFYTSDPNTYFDVEFSTDEKTNKSVVAISKNGSVVVEQEFTGDRWLYIKEVLISTMNGNTAGYIGVGMTQWQEPLYTTKTIYYDANGNEVSADSEDIVREETRYFDASGKEVSAEQASDTTLIEPASNASVSYANAYRPDYEFQKEFTSEYFYKREYKYNYVYNNAPSAKQTVVSAQGYTPYNANRDKIENLVDGNLNTYIHTRGDVSTNNPLILTVDLGEVVSANKMYINTQYRPNGDYKYASSFVLEGSVDGENFTPIADVQNAVADASHRVVVDFELTELRYYRLNITKSSGGFVIITRVDFSEHYELLNAAQYSIDDEMFKFVGKWTKKSTMASFGHVFVGQKGATVEFTFEGNRLAMLSSSAFERDFEVIIDGNVVTSDVFKTKDGDDTIQSFLSPILAQGKHTVKIKCKKNNCSIDSFAVWQAAETE